MLTPVISSRFKKDYRKVERQGKDLKKLQQVMIQLAREEALDPKYQDHYLTGNYKGRRECHIEPDWLLIYKVVGNEIYFERTGSHSELFR